MTNGFTAIASALIYLLIIRSLDSPSMNPKKATVIMVLSSLAIVFAMQALTNAMLSAPILTDMFTLHTGVNSVAQFFVAYFVFSMVERVGDEYLSFALWGGIGIALIFFVVPELTRSFLAAL